MNNKAFEIDVQKIQSKDQDELVRLAEYLTPRFRELARRYLPATSIHEADDLVQEALIKIISNTDKFRNVSEKSNFINRRAGFHGEWNYKIQPKCST